MENVWSKLIDDRGAWWDAGAWALRSALHLEDVEGDIRNVLVDNLGFIGVSLRQPGVIVRFRPRTVSKAALGTLLYWLVRRGRERVCLSFALDDRGLRHEIVASAHAAIRRMEALIELQLGSSALPSFAARTGALSEMDRGGSSFSALLEHWRMAGGIFDDEAYGGLLARFAGERYVLFEPCLEGLGFKIAHAGAGLQIPDEPSHRALTGCRLESIADRAYAQWTARFYRAALDSRQPQYDHIRALIRWPRAGRVERRYSRLILPCRTKHGRPLLLGVSSALAAPVPDVEVA
jgi:hypothetical protein